MTNNKPIVKADDNTTNELLNRLMAVEVRGWEWINEQWNFQVKGFNHPMKQVVLDDKHQPITFSPTTDMNQAMAVLEDTCRENCWNYTIYNSRSIVHCDIMLPSGEYLAEIVEVTAPLAICKAIAKAKGIDT